MMLFLSLSLSFAIYSPELFQEQTRHCLFTQTPTAAAPQILSSLLTGNLQEITRRYPLTSPWIKDDEFLKKLSQALYKNEANCQLQNLTYWNSKEPFPSLGLPHAIWYSRQNTDKKYQEQFPELIRFIRTHLKQNEKVALTWPSLISKESIGPAPWKNQEAFAKIQTLSLGIEATENAEQLLNLKERNPDLYGQAYSLFALRHFLGNPIVLKLQARYVIDKTFLALHTILQAFESEQPQSTGRVYEYLQTLLSSQEGVLALVDYLNFKGDGLKHSEKLEPSGFYWGLKTVLSLASHPEFHKTLCNDIKDPECALQKFSEASLCALQRVAYEAGPEGSDVQKQKYIWLNGGWSSRIESNYRPRTFSSDRCAKSTVSTATGGA